MDDSFPINPARMALMQAETPDRPAPTNSGGWNRRGGAARGGGRGGGTGGRAASGGGGGGGGRWNHGGWRASGGASGENRMALGKVRDFGNRSVEDAPEPEPAPAVSTQLATNGAQKRKRDEDDETPSVVVRRSRFVLCLPQFLTCPYRSASITSRHPQLAAASQTRSVVYPNTAKWGCQI
ncbi:hypothetical protein FN846DRAFT_499431 [Sphaerosporella brunnea]|uniref:Uncharacterized protein n=1 Tax=Sphaerosporella brunnea TaxID=1250544 RepID=A0A5J5EET0_9PEZI|nr:hypothetical protein FN846DRAFT_499431 [Sphaerosporella brunnea]